MHIVIVTEGKDGQILTLTRVDDAVDETQAINRVKRQMREEPYLDEPLDPENPDWVWAAYDLGGNQWLRADQRLDACDDDHHINLEA